MFRHLLLRHLVFSFIRFVSIFFVVVPTEAVRRGEEARKEKEGEGDRLSQSTWFRRAVTYGFLEKQNQKIPFWVMNGICVLLCFALHCNS